MLWLVVLVICVVIPLILIATNRGRNSQGPSTTEKRTMLYAPGSEDIAGEAYFPGRKDGAMPFPVGKKQERKKTETFRKYAEDEPRD